MGRRQHEIVKINKPANKDARPFERAPHPSSAGRPLRGKNRKLSDGFTPASKRQRREALLHPAAKITIDIVKAESSSERLQCGRLGGGENASLQCINDPDS